MCIRDRFLHLRFVLQAVRMQARIGTWQQSSGTVWKSRWPSWAPAPNKPTVSVDVKQQWIWTAQERLCESRGGRPGPAPVPNKPTVSVDVKQHSAKAQDKLTSSSPGTAIQSGTGTSDLPSQQTAQAPTHYPALTLSATRTSLEVSVMICIGFCSVVWLLFSFLVVSVLDCWQLSCCCCVCQFCLVFVVLCFCWCCRCFCFVLCSSVVVGFLFVCCCFSFVLFVCLGAGKASVCVCVCVCVCVIECVSLSVCLCFVLYLQQPSRTTPSK